MRKARFELFAGIFILAGLAAFFMLSLRVSSLSDAVGKNGYDVIAEFDNIGDLKVRAPVSMAGVKVGEVANIALNPSNFKAEVTLHLLSSQNKIPSDSQGRILTQGLLGGNYISLTPGFADSDEEVAQQDKYLHQGSQLVETHQAIILEDLIGQLMFSLTNKDKTKDSSNKEA